MWRDREEKKEFESKLLRVRRGTYFCETAKRRCCHTIFWASR